MHVFIKTVNYDRSFALPQRQFKEYLKEFNSEYGDKNQGWAS
jgi:hypothetical protein